MFLEINLFSKASEVDGPLDRVDSPTPVLEYRVPFEANPIVKRHALAWKNVSESVIDASLQHAALPPVYLPPFEVMVLPPPPDGKVVLPTPQKMFRSDGGCYI